MADSINNKAKEYYDNDDTGGSLNNNLKDFLKQQGAEGNSLNTLWRNYAYGEGGNSLNTRLGKLWGTSGSLVSRWKDVLGLTWDDLKLFFNARRNDPELLLSGATSFDGTGDYIQLASDGTGKFNKQNFTISAWVKISDNGWNPIFSYDFTSHASPYYALSVLSVATDSFLSMRLNNNGSNFEVVTSESIPVNVWTHIAVSNTNGSQKLYINGSLKKSATNTATITYYNQEVWIGKNNFATINGSISSLGFWERVLSASEIESIYWKGQYADLKNTELTNLVSWYNLSADANDSTGTNNGTNNGATFLTDAYSASSPFLPRIQDKATPKGAVALASGSTSFDGSDDFINLGQASNLNFDADADDFTISLWFKIASGVEGTIISKGGSTTGNRQYQIFKASNDTIGVFIGGTVVSTSAYSDGNWHHVAVVNFDDSGTQKFKIYVDGSSDGLGTSGSGSNSFDVLLGARRGSDNTDTGSLLDGSIANVAIYSDAKTQSQIQDIMFSSYSTLTSELKTNLVSWYDLGTNVEDSHGSNDGTNNGATINTGYTSSPSGVADPLNYGEVYGGNAVSFDGTNDYIDTGNAFQSTFRDSFSVSMWVKPDDGQPSAESSFFGTRNSTSQDWIQSNLHTDGKVSFFYRSDNDTAEAKTSSAVFANGVTSWTHITYVADDSDDQLKIYVNGSIVSVTNGGLGSITMADWTSSDELFIGARDNNGTAEKFFDGSINNVKIFNTVLTQDQVRELYTKPELTLPTGIASSALKLDMPMQEGSGVAILDGSGNQNHGTGVGITWATGQEYGFQHPLVRSNNPMVFDGSNDYVDCGTGLGNDLGDNYSGSLSMSMWFKADTTSSNDGLFHIGSLSSESGEFEVQMYNNTLRFRLSNTVWWRQYDFTDTSSWHHLVCIYDTNSESNSKMYIDGVSVGSTNGTFPSDADMDFNGLKTIIGSFYSTSLTFDGMINDVAIWGSALTANEVTALYNSGLPLLPTADSGNYASASDLVGYWRNDGVTTWLDRSTNSNNGTVSGSPASIIVPEGINEGRDSQGYYLTDTDSISSGIRFKDSEKIVIQDSETLDFETNDFSVAFWVYFKDRVINQGIWEKRNDTSNQIRIYTDADGYINGLAKTSGSTRLHAETNSAPSINQWTYVTWVCDRNSSNFIYVNGVAQTLANNTKDDGANDMAFGEMTIGRAESAAQYFNGYLDEFKIYKSKVLSATEVLKNYNNGKSAHSN